MEKIEPLAPSNRNIVPISVLFAAMAVSSAAWLATRGCRRALPSPPPPVAWGDDDITLEARDLGFDPDRCVQFVQKNVSLDTYFGLLRGPTGTLWAMSGSDLDKATLCAELLRRCNVPVTLAKGGSWGVKATIRGKPFSMAFGSGGGSAEREQDLARADQHRLLVKLGSGTTWSEWSYAVGPLADQQLLVVLDEKGEFAGVTAVGTDGKRVAPAGALLPLAGLKRLDLVLELSDPAGTVTRRTREIFTEELPGTSKRFHPENVISIFVTAGWVPDYTRERDLARTRKWSDRVAALHRRVAMSFLARSDEFARRLAKDHGVATAIEAPRITIVSSERDEDRVVVSLDLRKNDRRVDGPDDVRIAYNEARSLYDGALESRILEEITGAAATSANDLLANAFDGAGSSLAELHDQVAVALRRMLAEAPVGAELSISRQDWEVELTKQGPDVLREIGHDQDNRNVVPFEVRSDNLDESAAATVAALFAGPLTNRGGQVSITYSPSPSRRWYENSRLFYISGAESRLDFEKQITSFEPVMSMTTVDYFDETAQKWLDRPNTVSAAVAKEDVENARGFTTWYSGEDGSPTGYTIDMISRGAFKELRDKGSVDLDVVGANHEKLPKMRFYMMYPATFTIPVNGAPTKFQVLQVCGVPLTDDVKKPGRDAKWPVVADAAGLVVNQQTILDDPDYPLFMPENAYIQSNIGGRVVDRESGSGVDRATVTVKQPGVSAVSWPGGAFTLPTFRMPFNEFDLHVEAEGFEPLDQKIDFRDVKSFPLQLKMKRFNAGDPFAFVTKDTLGALDGIAIEEHSRSLIRAAIAERPQLVAVVPRFNVVGDAGPVDAWLEIDPASGEIYGRMQDGLYGASTGAGWNISNVQKPFQMQRKVINYYFGRIAAWYLFAAGALDSVQKAMDNPGLSLADMHRNAIRVARDLAKMYDSWVLKVPGNPVTDRSFLKGLQDGLEWADKYYGEAWK